MVHIQKIHQLITSQAEKSPDQIAILGLNRSPLTYHRLHQQISHVITKLNGIGVGRNDRVAVVLPNGPEMAVTFLAVASGAACTPLNPAYREKEFDFYLSDLNVKALIIQADMVSPARTVAQARGIPILELTSGSDTEAGIFELSGGEPADPSLAGFAQPEDVALVLHTSGTTSRPKMVPLSHLNLCTSAFNVGRALELGRRDLCLNVMPLFHIHGLIGVLLSSMAAGGSVVCSPGFSAPKFFTWLETFQPTWYSAVPTMQQAILAQAEIKGKTPTSSPIRLIRSSSASLPPQVMKELEQVFNAPVIEAYGMTEASHQMASNPLPPRLRKPGSVGMAAGPEVSIMDEAGRLLSTGEIGEVVIKGANVTHGYQNNPTANQQAFTNSWFRTGDQGYLDPDGYLFLKGRLKEIINRGGEKISPREVDEVILDHPAIAQVVTFALPHSQLGEDVGAAVVLNHQASTTEEAIQEFAAAQLADFKVPRRVIFLDEIPKGPTGKLQRIGLAEKLGLTASSANGPANGATNGGQQSIPEVAPSNTRLNASNGHPQTTIDSSVAEETIGADSQPLSERATYVAPRTSVEIVLAGIWAEALELEEVSIDDNFFNLGGQSLEATNIVADVQETFQVELPIFALTKTPTINEMATALLQQPDERVRIEKLAQLVIDIAQLSDQEAEAFLNASP